VPLAGYSGTPLVKKLGIKPGRGLLLVSAPKGFERELVGLPDDVNVTTRISGIHDLVLWFVTRRGDLETKIAGIEKAMGSGLWIAWPKKASGMPTDLVEDLVRNAGLAHGLVDYKVCAINETWSGLKFARRKSPPKAPRR
jgi:hypothetical protein